MIVLDHPILKALGGFLGRPIDGIIGFTFFARYKTTIDYQAKEMTFEPVDYEVNDLMKELPDRLCRPEGRPQARARPGRRSGPDPRPGQPRVPAPACRSRPSCPTPPPPRRASRSATSSPPSTAAGPPPSSDAYAAAQGLAPGKPVEAVVVREGKEVTLVITPRAGL